MAFQFMNSIYEKAKKNVKTIAIPEVTSKSNSRRNRKYHSGWKSGGCDSNSRKSRCGCVRNPCGRCE